MKRLLACSCVLAACGTSPTSPEPGADRPDGVALCYTPGASATPAVVGFRATFEAGDRSARAAAIDALDDAAETAPGDEELRLLLGLAHLWRLAEPLPGEESPLEQLPDAIGARDELRRAYELCPTDHRIAAWLGPILIRFGRTLNNPAMIDEGMAVLDRGIAAYPSFVLFSKLLVYADEPADAPEFQHALAAVVENSDACDRTPADPACTNKTVPHNREGAALFLGDVLAKAGRRADAEAVYRGAMAGPDFATWSFRPLIAERLEQLDDRIRRHATTDPADDPPVAWTATDQCALCHTR